MNRLPEFPRLINKETLKVFLLEMREKGLLYDIDICPIYLGYYNYKSEWIPTFDTLECYALIGFFGQAKNLLTHAEMWEVFPHS